MKKVLTLVLICFSTIQAYCEYPVPVPDNAQDFKIAQKVSDFEVLYSFDIDQSITELFEYYISILKESGWVLVSRNENYGVGIPFGQLAFLHEKEGKNINILGQFNSWPGGTLQVALDYVSDLKAAIAENEKQKLSKQEPIISEEEPLPSRKDMSFYDILGQIQNSINERDFESLYSWASPWFCSNYSKDYVERELDNLYVAELFSMFSYQGEELATVISKFEVRKDGRNELGYRVMYFDKIGEEWRFNDLPFAHMSGIRPSRMTKKFSKE